jgi:hypothetical protein
MDLQFWIYLIVAVIYLVSRAMKKSGSQPKEVQDYKPERTIKYDPKPPVSKPKQLTFEELLKEITEAKQPSKPVYQPVQPKPGRYINYDEQIEDEEKDLEVIPESYRKKDTIYNTYEDAKRQAFYRPSLEETMNVRDTNVEFGKFKVFEQQVQRNLLEDYVRNFQDPEGLKKAVVMSEILNRKF